MDVHPAPGRALPRRRARSTPTRWSPTWRTCASERALRRAARARGPAVVAITLDRPNAALLATLSQPFFCHAEPARAGARRAAASPWAPAPSGWPPGGAGEVRAGGRPAPTGAARPGCARVVFRRLPDEDALVARRSWLARSTSRAALGQARAWRPLRGRARRSARLADRAQHRLPLPQQRARALPGPSACARPSRAPSIGRALVADVLGGHGEPARNPLPPSLWGYADRTKELLARPPRRAAAAGGGGPRPADSRPRCYGGRRAAALHPGARAPGRRASRRTWPRSASARACAPVPSLVGLPRPGDPRRLRPGRPRAGRPTPRTPTTSCPRCSPRRRVGATNRSRYRSPAMDALLKQGRRGRDPRRARGHLPRGPGAVPEGHALGPALPRLGVHRVSPLRHGPRPWDPPASSRLREGMEDSNDRGVRCRAALLVAPLAARRPRRRPRGRSAIGRSCARAIEARSTRGLDGVLGVSRQGPEDGRDRSRSGPTSRSPRPRPSSWPCSTSSTARRRRDASTSRRPPGRRCPGWGAAACSRSWATASALTWRDLAVLMMGWSDNEATNVLIDRRGHGRGQPAAGRRLELAEHAPAPEDDGPGGRARGPGERRHAGRDAAPGRGALRAAPASPRPAPRTCAPWPRCRRTRPSARPPREAWPSMDKPGALEGVRCVTAVVDLPGPSLRDRDHDRRTCAATRTARRPSGRSRRRSTRPSTAWPAPATSGGSSARSSGPPAHAGSGPVPTRSPGARSRPLARCAATASASILPDGRVRGSGLSSSGADLGRIFGSTVSLPAPLTDDRRVVGPEDQLGFVLVVAPTAKGDVLYGGRALPHRAGHGGTPGTSAPHISVRSGATKAHWPPSRCQTARLTSRGICREDGRICCTGLP